MVDAGDVYEVLAARGYEYGPAFRGVRALWRRGQEVFAEVSAGEGVTMGGFGIHPVVLDAALHALGDCRGRRCDDAAVLLAGSLPACRRGIAGSGPDSAGRHRGGLGGLGRWRRAFRFCRCGSWSFVRSPSARYRRHWRRPPAAAAGCIEVAWSPVSLEPNDCCRGGRHGVGAELRDCWRGGVGVRGRS